MSEGNTRVELCDNKKAGLLLTKRVMAHELDLLCFSVPFRFLSLTVWHTMIVVLVFSYCIPS